MANKTYQAQKFLRLRTSVMAVASCLALTGMPSVANAAGLGRIVVFSALGQPLRAEIEVTATREELSGMTAKLAPPEAFKQAGLDYATTLLGIKFNLEKRPNGQPVLKLSSDRPINDPFVDMLMELNWSTGRLLREYTFLLDPPEVAAKNAAPVASATVAPTAPTGATGKAPAPTVRSSGIDDEVREKALARLRSRESAPAPQAAQPAAPAQPTPKATESSAESRDTWTVKSGDTLRKIATQTKPEGVSLDQMLVGLLRANQDAFDGGNMNRLKSGKILSVPPKATVESLPEAEARSVVVAQSSDWNNYRRKLAAAAAQTPVQETPAGQESAGKITAKVDDKAAPTTEPKDQLKVSKTTTAGGKGGAAAKASEEDIVARDKAIKEANERVAALEKNVADLQKLLELKNQNLAELQKQAAAQQAAPVAPPPPKPEVAPQPAAKAEAPAVPAPAPTPPPAAEKPSEPATPESKPEVKPEAPAPAPAAATEMPAAPPVPAKPKPAAPPPPPPPEPSIIDDLLDNPLLLGGAAAVLALGGALVVARRRRAGKEEAPIDLSSTLAPQSASLAANSVFRSTGGQSVDTSSHTPVQTDFSQAGPGSIDTDEVDPVAEADVYMAYGRDAQAEEILVEARQKDPKRYAIHLKLLEIYAGRKDVKQFEALATELYGETAGVGADWEKAAAMGAKLDPGNPLFKGAKVGAAEFDADATVVVSPQSMKNTVTMPGELSRLAGAAGVAAAVSAAEPSPVPAPVAAAVAPPAEVPDLNTLDFDLGPDEGTVSTPAAKPAPQQQLREEPVKAAEPAPLDFDLGLNAAPPAPAKAESAASAAKKDQTTTDFDFKLPDLQAATTSRPGPVGTSSALDFDLGNEPHLGAVATHPLGLGAETAKAEPSSVAPAVPADEEGVEFDVSLTESTFLGRSEPGATPYDMSMIDLDLGESASQKPAGKQPEPAVVPAAKPVVDRAEQPFDEAQVSTAVNPDFMTEQAETVFNPQFAAEPEDLLPPQDFSVSSTAKAPEAAPAQEEMLPEFEISANEEVATKLDLAKAYEEMGDLEGARELLQEVMKEGDGTQREKAQAILAKIGE